MSGSAWMVLKTAVLGMSAQWLATQTLSNGQHSRPAWCNRGRIMDAETIRAFSDYILWPLVWLGVMYLLMR